MSNFPWTLNNWSCQANFIFTCIEQTNLILLVVADHKYFAIGSYGKDRSRPSFNHGWDNG